MFEKVNPSHPDKIADRIAGALVDYAYSVTENPKIAVEVLIGHGTCTIITETSVQIPYNVVCDAVYRITCLPWIVVNYHETDQDAHLADNQQNGIRCGDNGIFKGVPKTIEQYKLDNIAHDLYKKFASDGKYILDDERNRLIICQSNAEKEQILSMLPVAYMQPVEINPLGPWTGGINVDSGATNRKLGSDMGDSVTGGGLHGKDLSKADVSVNIYAFLRAQQLGKTVEFCCAIGDDKIDGIPYSEIVEVARSYIKSVGGFEKFAEWGLI